ncbi:MAG: DUF3306 domain-containing protein [Hydrogenophaga sp.]|uniref:DUF3306 domain-containing protein n=1 Tax=Hydrogenophaga sp. TaxID=1904254 RepID=UPI0016BCAED9|nr:DUF3306 domain-containing protein [Hydrogenophaga sp.]NIM43120.1 DUF3306 domain-containing protein [Hydrogenophaga sp.]NIN28188.1 DUF3306 domain-containing protein [Hydrogenophaga sp.]NIN30626.1 DUF3306 domain-containing protein [Hydrogenophaga sp.]NIN57323.1 DUF3306 domain-containing protein [Hydrogenophaga sp.]NIO51542.1 DUF3306 domain-containing protein [Hydrogenophaga sp.]
MANGNDGFLSRWSRRKQAVRDGLVPPPEPAAAANTEALPMPSAPQAAPPAGEAADGASPAPRESTPPPTLDEVAQLTPEADFSRFVARDVSSEVRNAAVKKLFADPRFNVMDGLDVYIDDYSLPSPLSKADMASMVGARFLKLVDDPDEAKASATASDSTPSGGPTAATTGDAVADTPPTHDDHADLQLQPDHSPGRESPGHGAG